MFRQFLLNSPSLNFMLLHADRQTDNAKQVDAFHFALFMKYGQRLLRGAALFGSHRTSSRTLRRGNADEEVPLM
jgi:hypothetical protein